MSLARPWEDEYRRLLVDLEQRWTPKSASSTGPTGDARWQAVPWDEYPGFAGEREGDQIYVSLKADLLSLSVFRPLPVHIVIRPEGFVDRLLIALRLDWEYRTGNRGFDRRFYIEKIKTDDEKRLVGDSGFQRAVEKLAPFVSLAVTENGAHWSIALEGDALLSVGFLDEKLALLSKLVRVMAGTTS